jgi:hypothetical protein
MPINFGLLSDAALTGLSSEEKDSLQKQATTQFLLGSLLSNDASMGLKSALSVPDQYLSGQKAIADMQEKTRQRGEIANFLEQYAPTPSQAGQRALAAGGRGPTVAAGQNQIDILNAPIDFNRALSDSLRMAGNPAQPQIRETLKSMQPTFVDGLRVDNQGRIIGSLPQQKDQIQTQFNSATGRFEAMPVVGGMQAKVATTLPEVRPNQQLNFDPLTSTFSTNVLPGGAQAEQILNYNQKLGQGRANLETTPTNVVVPETGRTKRVTEAQALGQPTALSPSEVIAYESYKPIRDAAFKGFQAASSSDASLQNLQNIVNRGAFEPGKFAGFQSQAAAIATGLGIGGDRAKAVAVDSPLFLQSIADVASANIQDLVGATSDKDIAFSASRGPQITNPKESVQYYLDLTKVANQRKKDYYNYVSKNPVPDVVEKWSQTPQGSASIFEDPKLRKYLPKFPVKSGPDKGKTAYQLPNGETVLFD